MIAGVRDDQWVLPTPCAEWSVRDLVQHLITGNQLFARTVFGESSSTEPPGIELRANQSAAAYRQSAARTPHPNAHAATDAPALFVRWQVTCPVSRWSAKASPQVPT